MEKHIRALFNDQILNEAAQRFNVDFSQVKKVGGFENFIYGFEKEGKDYILRIAHRDHRELNMVKAELEWVNYLALHQANVSTPIKSINNQLVEVVKHPNGSYFTVTAYHKAKGRHLKQDDLSPQLYETYGRVMGQLHRLTKTYKEENSTIKRIHWDQDSMFSNARTYLPQTKQYVADKLFKLMDELNALPKDSDSYGLIHTDIHFGNFFIDDNRLTVFDFDDCAYKWFISDIAIALFYRVALIEDSTKRIQVAKEMMIPFLNGYRKENTLSDFWIQKLPLFLKLRQLVLYVVIHRSCDMENPGPWESQMMKIHQSLIDQDLPVVDMDFSIFV